MAQELRERRVLVTGASSGIGESAARQFAKAGARVVLVSEREDDLKTVTQSIMDSGGQALYFVSDFSKPEQVAGLIARAEEQIGPLDILVNNAGVGLGATVLETKPSDLRFLFEVNFFSLAELCREALSVMAPRKQGHIINVSSAAGRFGSPAVSAYSATKGAVHTYTQALRMEAGVHNVFVTEVLPISVRTKFFDNVKGSKYKPAGVVLTTESVAASIVQCARAAHPPAEVLPYRPVRAAFALESLLPNLVARLMARNYLNSWQKQK